MLSLLQQNALYAAFRLCSKDVTAEVDSQAAENSINSEWVTEFLLSHDVCNIDQMSTVDANFAYFISGYIGRSIC